MPPSKRRSLGSVSDITSPTTASAPVHPASFTSPTTPTPTTPTPHAEPLERKPGDGSTFTVPDAKKDKKDKKYAVLSRIAKCVA